MMKRNRVKDFLQKKKSRVKFVETHSAGQSADHHNSSGLQPDGSFGSNGYYERTNSLPPRLYFSQKLNLQANPLYVGDYHFESLNSKFSTMEDPQRLPKRARTEAYPVKGPRFVPANTDLQMRGHDHGYYIQAAKLQQHHLSRNRDNLNLVNRTHLTPSALASAATSSRYSSHVPTRQSSFKSDSNNGQPGHRLYRQNKRPQQGQNGAPANGFFYTENPSSDVAMRIYRKKKQAPPPPPKPFANEPQVKTLVTVSAVRTDVYPIEPPKDYEKKPVEESEEEDEEEVEDEVHVVVETEQPEDQSVQDEDMPQSPPAPPSPPPPPLPPPLPPPSSMLSKKSDIDKKARDLKKEIEESVVTRFQQARSHSDPTPRQQSMQEMFAAELADAYAKRQARRQKGVVNVVQRQNSKIYKAISPRSPRTPRNPTTPLGEILTPHSDEITAVIDKAVKQNGGVTLTTSEDMERRSYIDEWMPAQDLDEPPEPVILRAHYSSPNRQEAGQSDLKSSKHRSGAFQRMKKSLGKTFGSIGRNLYRHLSSGTPEQLYKEEDGWQIMYQDKNTDQPPLSSASVNVKQVEVHPAFAYNSEKGQLVLLPSYDRIIVTEDNKRYRQSEMTQAIPAEELMSSASGKGKSKRVKHTHTHDHVTSSKSSSRRERAKSLHEDQLEQERKEQDLVEMQFEALQQLNKRPVSMHDGRTMRGMSKSTPDLTSVEPSSRSELDLAMSMQNLDLTSKQKPKKVKQMKRKKSAPASPGFHRINGRSRSRVLQKGLRYYMDQHSGGDQATTNPVYSSDDDDDIDDDGDDDQGHFSDSDTPATATVSMTIQGKQEKHSDSGLGNGSVNSGSSNGSTVGTEDPEHNKDSDVTPQTTMLSSRQVQNPTKNNLPSPVEIIPPPLDFS